MANENGHTTTIPRALAAELVICEIMLALGLQAMLEGYKFESFRLPSFLIMLGLLILIVWVAQLLVSWSTIYPTLSPKTMPMRGMIHLWVYVPYTGLVYLSCKYQDQYPWPLLFITLIVILDIISSTLDAHFSKNKIIHETNHNWWIRDLLLIPLIMIAWIVYLQVDQSSGESPSIWSSLMFLGGMTAGYIFDLIANREFYGLWSKSKASGSRAKRSIYHRSV
jgi:hypothetical protein